MRRAMPHLQLQAHVSFAIVDDRAVFLDLRRDRYFMLDGLAASAFEALRCDTGHGLDPSTAAPLLATGLFTSAARPVELSPVTISSVQSELPPAAARSFAPADLVEIGWLVRQARRALRSKPLEKLIDRSRRALPRGSRNSTDKIVDLACRFRRARAWVPIAPSCLQDSLALHQWLRRRRASADLVVGVKLNPFAAHSWVQSDGMVLNDAPERVAAFTPILTVQCS